MTADVPAESPIPAVPAPAAPLRPPSWIWRNRDLAVTPVLVVARLALVLPYTAHRELDSVEQRALSPPYLWDKFVEHIWLTGASTVLVIAGALPLGIALSRSAAGRSAGGRSAVSRIRTGTLAFGGFMQALPPYGVIILLAFLLSFGTTTAIIALVLSSFLPVLTNTVVGLRQVEPALIEAARGMGLSVRQTLLRVEIPLAAPVMVAGIRVALVLNVGTATLATFIGAGGLGEPISSMPTSVGRRLHSSSRPSWRRWRCSLIGWLASPNGSSAAGSGDTQIPMDYLGRKRRNAWDRHHRVTTASPLCWPRWQWSSRWSAQQVNLAGQSYTVGGKNFDEQLVLCQIAVAALESVNAQVTDRCNIGGTDTVRKALLRDDISLYWEYTGTAWVSFLGQTPIPDSAAQYEAVKGLDLTQNQIVWLQPTPFNNIFALAVNKERAEQLGLRTLSDMAGYIRSGQPGNVCIDSEYQNRDDGIAGLREPTTSRCRRIGSGFSRSAPSTRPRPSSRNVCSVWSAPLTAAFQNSG